MHRGEEEGGREEEERNRKGGGKRVEESGGRRQQHDRHPAAGSSSLRQLEPARSPPPSYSSPGQKPEEFPSKSDWFGGSWSAAPTLPLVLLGSEIDREPRELPAAWGAQAKRRREELR